MHLPLVSRVLVLSALALGVAACAPAIADAPGATDAKAQVALIHIDKMT
jgi:hypothetical protein